MIGMDKTLVQNLQRRFKLPLPGVQAQLKMTPDARRFLNDIPKEAVPAGVLVLLFPKNDEWHITLIERNTHQKDKHSGQIGFPGGKIESTDASYAAGALREVEEEVGIQRERIRILGALTPLFIHVSNFVVHPFLGFLEDTPKFSRQVEEVKRVLQIPVSDLLNPGLVKTKGLKVRPNITLVGVPYYDLAGKTVWGATAMILSELKEMMISSSG